MICTYAVIAILTGVIGRFVVISTTETLVQDAPAHQDGQERCRRPRLSGRPPHLDPDEPIVYGTFLGVTATPTILFLTQALNAVMLLPLLAMIIHLCRDPKMMGSLKIGQVVTVLAWTTFALITLAVVTLGAYSLP